MTDTLAARIGTVRSDWTLEQVESLFDLPFNDLLYHAHGVHRAHFDPNAVQMSTLLSIKTGGCPEDCAYCPQSVRFRTGVEAEPLMALEDVLEHLRAMSSAVGIPVNADFEGGFAIAPEGVAANVRAATGTGIAGLSIEDSTGDASSPLFDFALSVERIAAARQAIDRSGTGVVLTARSEGFLVGRADLAETIRRLNAYAAAGADCLYAPGLRDLATIRTVVQSVSRPINVVMSAADPSLTVAQLAEAGVKRISVGGALSRLALAAFLRGAREMKEHGAFTWVRDTVPTRDLRAIFG